MEFTFTEELEQLRKEGRGLAEQVPATAGSPVFGSAEAGVFGTLAAKGAAAAYLPSRYGGRELGAAEACALWEGLGEGTADAGLVLALSAHALLTAVPLWKLGSPEQRRHYLPHVATGEWTGALSLHELEGGASPANLGVRAVRRAEGGWLLSGAKAHVINASFAHHFLVTAVGDGGTASAFVIDRDAPGLRVERAADGFDALVLDGCPAQEQALLGTEGAAFHEVLPLLLALDSTVVLAPWLGIMRALTDRALRVVLDAEVFGRPVERLQTVRFTLADMRTRRELSEGLLHRAAWQLDGMPEPGRQDAAVARLFVTESARSVVADATRILALAGQFADPVAERAARDVVWLETTAGGVDVLRSVIAGSLLGLG